MNSYYKGGSNTALWGHVSPSHTPTYSETKMALKKFVK